MNDQIKKAMDQLKRASPLEATGILQQIELYDAKSSQIIIDEVYEQFKSGDNMRDEVLKPVFLSVIDGLLEATAGGRAARKKGLTASRVLQECDQFNYDDVVHNKTNVNGYTEYKNAREFDDKNSHMTQHYNRENRTKLYEDKEAMDKYKNDNIIGEKTLKDEYTGKSNLYHKQNNPNKHYNDETHRKQAQPDHIVSLKQMHDKFKENYALDDSDIKTISNIEDNFAITSAEINQVKKDMSNKEYIKWMDENGRPVDSKTRKNMINLQKKAEKAVDAKANETVFKNLLGKGEVNEETKKAAFDKFKKENGGEAPNSEQKKEIEDKLRKEKTAEIRGTAVKNAGKQAADYAIGNLMLFVIKPIYFELSDIFKNGLQEGVGASSGYEAIKIRFGRVKRYVLTHAKGFFGDNLWEFVKGFISSLLEGIISLFTGMLKQILKIVKEGIKIFVQSAKVLFGKDAKDMSSAEKGDAIIKLLGGSVIALSGIGIEFLINKIGIVEPWSIVVATMFSGIASALFMYILDKADLFSVKAEKRSNRIQEIFEERVKDIQEVAETCNLVAVEILKRQRGQFEEINDEVDEGIKSNNIVAINRGLYKMADFFRITLPYSNLEEFCDYMDSEEAIQL